MSYEFVLTRMVGRVGVVQFNRPKALNAFNMGLITDAINALAEFDAHPEIGAMLVHGYPRAFAAGADIKQMAGATPASMLDGNFIEQWDRLKSFKKPIIAAVSGFALGGGCEFAMACDMIVASESAQFGQPEINIGVIPGAGGTQRLTRAVGKSLAMEVCLGGRFLSAEEALRYGLINHIYPVETYVEESIKFAQKIASQAPIALRLAKQAVNASYEMTLAEGVNLERNLFYMLFSTEDQKEGMDAFVNKRKPNWSGR